VAEAKTPQTVHLSYTSDMLQTENIQPRPARSALAGVLLVRGDGKLLLLKRSDYVVYPGTWNLPGGGIDSGETAYHAAMREFREEAGEPPRGHIERSCTVDNYTAFVLYASMYAVQGWTPRLNWESDAYGWFYPTATPTVYPALRMIIDHCLLS